MWNHPLQGGKAWHQMCAGSVRSDCSRHVRRPRDVAAVRELSRGGPARRGRDLLPAPRAGLLECLLVQLPAYIPAEDIFSRLRLLLLLLTTAGCSTRSASSSRRPRRLGLGDDSFVVEVASNDGYLLQHASTAASARSASSRPRTSRRPPGRAASRPRCCSWARSRCGGGRAEHGPADLVVANNVFAHVPDIVDFSKGLRALVADDGYVSHRDPAPAAADRGQRVRHDLPRALLLRVAADHPAGAGRGRAQRRRRGGARHPRWFAADLVAARSRWPRPPSPAVERCWPRRRAAGLDTLEGHAGFATSVAQVRNDLLEFLIGCQRRGERVVAYGAPGKGNTLLNHCGIRADLVEFSVDRNPYKHGRFLPGDAHPDPSGRGAAEAAAGLRADHAVEPASRDQRTARVRPDVGWSARGRPARLEIF